LFAVAAADVDCIAHTLDFDALQDNITNIAFCDIEQELVCMSHTHVTMFWLRLYKKNYNFNRLNNAHSNHYFVNVLSLFSQNMSMFNHMLLDNVIIINNYRDVQTLG